LGGLAGRADPARRDSRLTRDRLVDAVAAHVAATGDAPARLADLAPLAGTSVATAYRWFSSVDDAVRAYVLRLPEQAVARFAGAGGATSPEERLLRWDRAWVRSCLAHGRPAVQLRSTDGFLRRRAAGDPVVRFVCDVVEPLLAPFTHDVVPALVVWNAVSDPREVLDLRSTERWSAERIARFVTSATLAAAARGA